MYLDQTALRDVRQRYGNPETRTASGAFTEREFQLLEYCRRKNRAHDVTLFIRDPEGRFAVIRKPTYPPDVFRPPSGGVEPGESLEAGAQREAREETGLDIRLERYLLRIEARFTYAGRVAPWTTHVFLAKYVGGQLSPTDHHEIAEARWATLEELVHRYRPAMLAVGSEGMRYRVELQDLTLRALGLMDLPKTTPGRVIHDRPGDVPGISK